MANGEEVSASGSMVAALCTLFTAEQPLAAPICWPLAELDEAMIGRGIESGSRLLERRLEIRIRDEFMSRHHLRIWRCPSGWMIADTNSKNGTRLNGLECTRLPLCDGDLVSAGATFFQFVGLDLEGRPCRQSGTAPAPVSFTPSVLSLQANLVAIAPSDVPVLLLGETGVGKEVAARTIHERSGRTGAFVGVNCAALPPTLAEAALFGHRRGAFTGAVDNRTGLVRTAQDGTLFLDEVGELSLATQAALLRVLQEREVVPIGDTEPISVNARIVAASNRDLLVEAAHGRFRDDLLARLAGLTLRLIPLRERRADLGLLIHALLARLAPTPNAVRLTCPAARALVDYRWPGNIRELEMCLRAAGQLAGWSRIERRHLPEVVAAPRRSAPMHDHLVALLQTHRGNLTAVARELKTSRMQVHRLLKQCMLDPCVFRE